MLTLGHWIVVALYLAIVPVSLVEAAVRSRRLGHYAPLGSLAVTCLVGAVLGISVSVIYATAVQGRLNYWQVFLAAFFASAMLLVIKLLDRLLRAGLVRAFAAGRASGWSKIVRLQLAGSVRVILLFGLALPYVMAAVMTYRPKVSLADDPSSQLGFQYQTVEFRATDGMKLRGWWIDAAPRTSDDRHWGRRTVVICHGLGSNRSNQLIMARRLVPAGYNVLAFDFRAHGESGGQLSTFGDHERFDVLGAVRWLRENRAEQSRKIFGLGASMGAAALIAAAADDSPEGRAIDALALYACYDDLGKLASDIAAERFAHPADWLLRNVSLPLASLQTGCNLADFAPARLVPHIWPRPILFIHGVDDQVIPFRRGAALHSAADVPKWHIWLERGDHNDIINSDFIAEVVRRYFDAAKPFPVI
jgi:alpha-beta hydrolase superfamily lysophospholipase